MEKSNNEKKNKIQIILRRLRAHDDGDDVDDEDGDGNEMPTKKVDKIKRKSTIAFALWWLSYGGPSSEMISRTRFRLSDAIVSIYNTEFVKFIMGTRERARKTAANVVQHTRRCDEIRAN